MDRKKELTAVAETVQKIRNRSNEATIGCAVGTFDILHPGHIHHLREAKEKCSDLIIFLTGDKFVSKGFGRPYHNEESRKYMLDSIFLSDRVFIFINNAPDAIEVLKIVRPDFYFKGCDYATGIDVHGKLQEEKTVVKLYGGKLIFTSPERVGSSSKIFNAIHSFDGDMKRILHPIKEKGGLEYFETLFKNKEAAFQYEGEIITDRYLYVDVNGVSSKNPIITAKPSSEEYISTQSGGRKCIQEHASEFCNQTSHENSKIAITKDRFINNDNKQKLFEMVYSNTLKHDYIIHPETTDIMFCDFGHGEFDEYSIALFFSKLERRISESKIRVHLMVQANSSNFGFNTLDKWKPFSGYIYHISLDMREGRLYCRNQNAVSGDIAEKIQNDFNPKYLMLTRGREGLTLYTDDSAYAVPALTKSTVDTIGCGDAVLAISSVLMASGAIPEAIALGGAIAGALHSQVVGNSDHIHYNSFIETIKGYMS